MMITRRAELDMGHCLPDHEGKCYRPHGHRYVVELSIEQEVIDNGPERGMVADFARMRETLDKVLADYDHRFVMAVDDPRVDDALVAFGDGIVVIHVPPTVENLAALWASDIRDISSFEPVQLRVYETPNCWADWCE